MTRPNRYTLSATFQPQHLLPLCEATRRDGGRSKHGYWFRMASGVFVVTRGRQQTFFATRGASVLMADLFRLITTAQDAAGPYSVRGDVPHRPTAR